MKVIENLLLSLTYVSLFNTSGAQAFMFNQELIKDTTECQLCVHSLDMFEQELINKIEPKTIQNKVEELCSLFKKPSQYNSCLQLLGEVMVEGVNFFKNYVPYAICEKLQVCVAKTKKQKLEKKHLNEFVKFKKNYNKKYDNIEEYIKRHKIFKENYIFIEEHNKKKSSFKLGVNHIADMTNNEFTSTYTNRIMKYHYKNKLKDSFECKQQDTFDSYNGMLGRSAYPKKLDWREKGVVGKVRNQKSCGSCWSFGSAESIESMNAIHTGNLVVLSEQDLIANDKNDLGCNGGIPEHAYEYAINNGLCYESECPYMADDKISCDNDNCSKKIYIDDCMDVNMSQESLIKALQNGPITVAIEADKQIFQFYKNGILSSDECGTQLDHAVQVVGYYIGDTNNDSYWIVRNSWGESWSDLGGYIHIGMSDTPFGICGINMAASQPIIYDKDVLDI